LRSKRLRENAKRKKIKISLARRLLPTPLKRRIPSSRRRAYSETRLRGNIYFMMRGVKSPYHLYHSISSFSTAGRSPSAVAIIFALPAP